MASFPLKIYEKLVFDHPGVAISLAILTVLFFAYHVPQFRLDASSDSLSLENDQAIKYYRAIRARYGSDDFLIVTYSPKKKELFDSEILADLGSLRDSLAALERVQSVTSILDVPLIESPPVTLQELSKGIRTLAAPGTDQGLAREELISSPLYRDLLMSRGGQTTAVLVSFYVDSDLEALRQKRDRLWEKELQASLTVEEKRQLEAAAKAYSTYYAEFQDQWQNDIADVRSILEQHQDQADIFLGGVPMIVADSIDFIARDLRTFGAGMMVFLIVFLAVIFRRVQWVLLPMLVCVCVGISVIGFLSLANWPVTIVSSNFISLLLIFTLSFSVHQIVRYRECAGESPDADQRALVGQMVRTIGVPCFYMVFTTIVAFGSLVVSGIRPVIDFGWMMAIGLAISFILSFTLFPAALMLLKPEPQGWGDDVTSKVTLYFAKLVQRRG